MWFGIFSNPTCALLPGDLENEKDHLNMELTSALERHKQDVINAAQIQELASMLQESHRSLVATNDHLLQELEETKQRHYQEVMQMNSNYEQLKKTVHLMQHAWHCCGYVAVLCPQIIKGYLLGTGRQKGVVWHGKRASCSVRTLYNVSE